MIDEIVRNIINKDEFRKELINSSEIKSVQNELKNVVKDLKKINYDDWFRVDQLIGQLELLNQMVFFKAGFNEALKLIDEIKEVQYLDKK